MLNTFRTITMKNDKDHEIIIQDMIHVAPIEFLNQREQEWLNYSDNGYIILAEGVKIPVVKNTLKEFYTYLAEQLGLSMQRMPNEIPNLNYKIGDISWEDCSPSDKLKFITLIKFIGLAEKAIRYQFSNAVNPTQQRLNLAKQMKEMLNKPTKKDNTLRQQLKKAIFMDFLLKKRNIHVVNMSVKEKSNVVIPWGKAHNDGIIELLEKNGYSIKHQAEINLNSFYDRIIHDFEEQLRQEESQTKG